MGEVVKNGLVISLGLVILLSTSFTNAEAAVKGKTAGKNNASAVVKKVIKKIEDKVEKIQPQKLEGVVKAVYERDMNVLDKNGKIYIVPIEAFLKMDGFKNLKLDSGTNVVLEGFEPAAHKTVIKLGDVSPAGVPDKDMVIKELKDDDIIFEQAAGTEKPNIVIHQAAIPADKEPLGDGKPFQIFIGGKTPPPGSPADILKPLEGNLFLPTSITANGETITLDKMATPTKIKIKKEDIKFKVSKKDLHK